MTSPTVSIDAEQTAKFATLLTEKFATGDVNTRKAYLRSIIDAVEVDEKVVRIVGKRSTLRDVIAGRSTASEKISGSDRKWRARKE